MRPCCGECVEASREGGEREGERGGGPGTRARGTCPIHPMTPRRPPLFTRSFALGALLAHSGGVGWAGQARARGAPGGLKDTQRQKRRARRLRGPAVSPTPRFGGPARACPPPPTGAKDWHQVLPAKVVKGVDYDGLPSPAETAAGAHFKLSFRFGRARMCASTGEGSFPSSGPPCSGTDSRPSLQPRPPPWRVTASQVGAGRDHLTPRTLFMEEREERERKTRNCVLTTLDLSTLFSPAELMGACLSPTLSHRPPPMRAPRLPPLHAQPEET